jgi:cell division septum initiation protein DivIVA
VVRQSRAFSDEVAGLLEMIVDALDHPEPHAHAKLLGQIDAILERLAEFDRTPSDPRVSLAQINRRLEALEAAEAGRATTTPGATG